jgi:hypothetical protein
MRRARVRGSWAAASSPPSDPGVGKEEPRRSRVGERVVPEGATGARGTSALTGRDVLSAISGLGLRGSGFVVEPIREGCCGGVGGGVHGEELSWCGTERAAVFAAAGEGEVFEMVVGSNQEGGGKSVAFWLLFSFSVCFPFLPNLTNCSKA